MADCLFCAIASGATPAATVLETEHTVGFLDHRPVFKGHVLLVPREHIATLPDLPAALRDPFLEAGQRLAQAMVDGLGAQGSFVVSGGEVGPGVVGVVVPAVVGAVAGLVLEVGEEVVVGEEAAHGGGEVVE